MTRILSTFFAAWPFRRSRPLWSFTLAAGLFFFSTFAHGAHADRITVFAAASLKGALDEVATDFSAVTGHVVTMSYAGSSILARQVSLGAPADLFISANVDWMDVLERDNKILPATRIDVVGNTLVLVAPETMPVTSANPLDLVEILSDRRLAMGLVNAVPAGIYGKAALTHYDLWDRVRPQVLQGDNVRAALALVALKQAAFGIVYGSDAFAEPRVKVVLTFPTDSYPKIRYPAAVVAGGNETIAAEFLNWLTRAATKPVFTRHGFTVLESS